MAGKLSKVRGGRVRTKDDVDGGVVIVPADAPPVTVAWRPIETAPKDGTEILIAGTYVLLGKSERQFVGLSSWWKVRGHWAGHSPTYYRVTHWMPKPDPPPRGKT